MSTAARIAIDDENPWPGLGSFDETAERFFNGRGNESAALRRLVVHAPLTVLFSASGLGKTSLLQAGLFPLLRKEHFLPVYVRLDVRDRAAPLIDQLTLALQKQFEQRQIEAAELFEGDSLWAYLHRTALELWSSHNQLLTPVFVFDQFEEIFTLGAENLEAIARLRVDLADLIENRMPADLARRLSQNETAGDSLSLDSQRYKVILSFREDFLPAVEGWKREIPSILRNRLRLLPMSGEQAFQAVYETGSRLVDRPLAHAIVRFVAAAAQDDGKTGIADSPDGIDDLSVEPALLSVVCHGLNEKRKAQRKTAFDAALLSGTGQAVIFEYYRDAVAEVPKRVHRFIQDELITERGFRKSCDVDDARSVHGVTDGQLRLLVDRRLLRIEPQRGTERVELTHDLLTRVVREHRDKQRERAKRLRMALFGAVGVVLAGLVVVFGSLYFEASAQRRKAEEETRRADAEKTAAETASENAKAAQQRAELAVAEKQKTADALEIEKERAIGARQDAERQAAIAAARQLATEALYTFDSSTDGLAASGALAAASLNMDPTAEGMKAIGQVLRLIPPAPQMIPNAHPRSIRALAFSRDGRWMASVALDSTVALWDLSDRMRKTVLELRAPTAPSGFGLAFSPDGQWLAAGAMGSLWIWNTTTGARAQEPIMHDGLVRSVSFSPDGRHMATASRDSGAVRIFEYVAASWNELPAPTWTTGKYRANSASFVTNTLLALAGNYGLPQHGVWFWNLEQKKDAFLGESDRDSNFGECRALALSQDARRLAALCRRGIFVANRDEATFSASSVSREDSNSFSASYGLSISNDGRYVAATDNGGIVRVFGNLEEQEISRMIRPASSVAFGTDGKVLAAGLVDGGIAMWPTTKGTASIRLPVANRVHSVAFSPDERWLVTAGDDATLRVFDITEPSRAHQIQSWSIGPDLGRPFFSPDARFLVLPSRSAVHVIETRPWKRRLENDLPGEVKLATFSPGGRLLITLSAQGIRRFDVATWKQVMPAMPGAFDQIRFSPDGRLIGALGDRSGRGRYRIRLREVWDLTTGEIVAWREEGRLAADGPAGRPPQGGQQALIAALDKWADVGDPSIAADSAWRFDLDDRTLTLQERSTRRTVARFEHDADVLTAAFSPGRRWVATSSGDGAMRLWPLQPKDMLEQACKLLPRNLTPQEWTQLKMEGPYRKTCPNLP